MLSNIAKTDLIWQIEIGLDISMWFKSVQMVDWCTYGRGERLDEGMAGRKLGERRNLGFFLSKK